MSGAFRMRTPTPTVADYEARKRYWSGFTSWLATHNLGFWCEQPLELVDGVPLVMPRPDAFILLPQSVANVAIDMETDMKETYESEGTFDALWRDHLIPVAERVAQLVAQGQYVKALGPLLGVGSVLRLPHMRVKWLLNQSMDESPTTDDFLMWFRYTSMSWQQILMQPDMVLGLDLGARHSPSRHNLDRAVLEGILLEWELDVNTTLMQHFDPFIVHHNGSKVRLVLHPPEAEPPPEVEPTAGHDDMCMGEYEEDLAPLSSPAHESPMRPPTPLTVFAPPKPSPISVGPRPGAVGYRISDEYYQELTAPLASMPPPRACPVPRVPPAPPPPKVKPAPISVGPSPGAVGHRLAALRPYADFAELDL